MDFSSSADAADAEGTASVMLIARRWLHAAFEANTSTTATP
jgi:hypothetical protein